MKSGLAILLLTVGHNLYPLLGANLDAKSGARKKRPYGLEPKTPNKKQLAETELDEYDPPSPLPASHQSEPDEPAISPLSSPDPDWSECFALEPESGSEVDFFLNGYGLGEEDFLNGHDLSPHKPDQAESDKTADWFESCGPDPEPEIESGSTKQPRSPPHKTVGLPPACTRDACTSNSHMPGVDPQPPSASSSQRSTRRSSSPSMGISQLLRLSISRYFRQLDKAVLNEPNDLLGLLAIYANYLDYPLRHSIDISIIQASLHETVVESGAWMMLAPDIQRRFLDPFALHRAFLVSILLYGVANHVQQSPAMQATVAMLADVFLGELLWHYEGEGDAGKCYHPIYCIVPLSLARRKIAEKTDNALVKLVLSRVSDYTKRRLDVFTKQLPDNAPALVDRLLTFPTENPEGLVPGDVRRILMKGRAKALQDLGSVCADLWLEDIDPHPPLSPLPKDLAAFLASCARRMSGISPQNPSGLACFLSFLKTSIMGNNTWMMLTPEMQRQLLRPFTFAHAHLITVVFYQVATNVHRSAMQAAVGLLIGIFVGDLLRHYEANEVTASEFGGHVYLLIEACSCLAANTTSLWVKRIVSRLSHHIHYKLKDTPRHLLSDGTRCTLNTLMAPPHEDLQAHDVRNLFENDRGIPNNIKALWAGLIEDAMGFTTFNAKEPMSSQQHHVVDSE